MPSELIQTERFVLKPLSIEHATAKYANWLIDPASQKFIVTASQYGLEYLREYIAKRCGRPDVLFLGIFLRETGEHIGNVKYEPINYSEKSAVCGILVGEPQWRGKGVAGEVIKASSRWLQAKRGISRILLGVSPGNPAALRVYEKLGFRCFASDGDGNLKMSLDLKASKNLAIGTALFGMDYGVNKAKRTEADEVRRILDFASERGIDTLDTAAAYGESEATLGRVSVQNWKVISKLGAVPAGCAAIEDWIEGQIRTSLRNLQVPKLHGILLHVPGQLLETFGDKIYEALAAAKQNGLAEKIGITIYDPSELDAVCSRYRFDLVQAPFNPLDRRLIESGWMRRLYDSGIELHCRSIFLQGLLLMKCSDRPQKFRRWSHLWSVWDQWLQQNHLTPLVACLRYALAFPEISKVFIGVESLKQLEEIYTAVPGGLPAFPSAFQSQDLDLLNPSKWSSL